MDFLFSRSGPWERWPSFKSTQLLRDSVRKHSADVRLLGQWSILWHNVMSELFTHSIQGGHTEAETPDLGKYLGPRRVGLTASFFCCVISVFSFAFHSSGTNRVQEWGRNQLKVTSQQRFQLYYTHYKKKTNNPRPPKKEKKAIGDHTNGMTPEKPREGWGYSW